MDYSKSNIAYPSLSPPLHPQHCSARVILKEAQGFSFVCEQEREGKKQLPFNGKTKQKPGYLKVLSVPTQRFTHQLEIFQRKTYPRTKEI